MGKRIDKDHNEFSFTFSHIFKILQKSSYSACELFITIDKGIIFFEMILDFLDESLNCCKNTP